MKHLSKITIMITLTILSLSNVAQAQGPFGHAPKHGMDGVDVTHALVQGGQTFYRQADGRWAYLSNGFGVGQKYDHTLTYVDGHGNIATAFPVTSKKVAGKVRSLTQSGYRQVASHAPQRLAWGAKAWGAKTVVAAQQFRPPIVVSTNWRAFCAPNETMAACLARWRATRKG